MPDRGGPAPPRLTAFVRALTGPCREVTMPMSQTIWKYTLDIGFTRLSLPKGAQVLDVQMQGEALRLWARVDPEAGTEVRDFVVAGTGHTIQPDWRHVTTFQLPSLGLVFHVFETPAP